MAPLPGTPPMLLIRHPPVDARYRGICYGRSDVGLGPGGGPACETIARAVAVWPIVHIVHSGLQRTGLLAEAIGRRVGIRPTYEIALQERDFGAWELRPWDDIYRECGDDMSKMVTDPQAFRPGGGETTSELAARVHLWSREWTRPGLTVVVSHGGPIAAILGNLRSLSVAHWPSLIPACGGMVWCDPDPAPRGPA